MKDHKLLMGRLARSKSQPKALAKLSAAATKAPTMANSHDDSQLCEDLGTAPDSPPNGVDLTKLLGLSVVPSIATAGFLFSLP